MSRQPGSVALFDWLILLAVGSVVLGVILLLYFFADPMVTQ